jgi:transcription termination/antitermination protein NusG
VAFFALQAWTGDEGKVLYLARRRLRDKPVRLYWPRRSLTIRRAGVKKDSLAPIFPSYLFLQGDEIDWENYWILRKTPGFIRFLPSNETPRPLSDRDQELLCHFLSFGEIVKKSLVYFDENNRIRVVSGPLTGLEGRIVKVDRRKRRAKLYLDMYGESYTVDLGFDTLELAAPAAPGPMVPSETAR